MRLGRKITSLLIITILLLPAAGCWNYKEIDKLSIVAGVAIDKGSNEAFEVTVELIQVKAGKETNIKSNTLSAEGKTLFDAIRNLISISGKRLYWNHTKVLIIGKRIAQDGVARILDWYNRDSETREDVHLLISQGETAKEIFIDQQNQEEILSFALDQILENEVSLSKTPVTDILSYDIEDNTVGASTVVPAIGLRQVDNKKTPQIMGSAIIKNDRLAGFLDGEETRDLMFIRDEIKGGVLVEEMQAGAQTTSIAFEIFKSKTKTVPKARGIDVEMNLRIKTDVAIDEINGAGDFINGEELEKLKRKVQNSLVDRIGNLINKMQTQYGADVFKFGAALQENDVKAYERLKQNWEETFRNIHVNVDTQIKVRNSATFAKPVIGEE